MVEERVVASRVRCFECIDHGQVSSVHVPRSVQYLFRMAVPSECIKRIAVQRKITSHDSTGINLVARVVRVGS